MIHPQTSKRGLILGNPGQGSATTAALGIAKSNLQLCAWKKRYSVKRVKSLFTVFIRTLCCSASTKRGVIDYTSPFTPHYAFAYVGFPTV